MDSILVILERANIELCEHQRITDADVLAILFGMMNPEGEFADPIGRYSAEEAGMRCGRCDTEILIGKGEHICQVYVRRFLGKGQSADNSVWLAHCVG